MMCAYQKYCMYRCGAHGGACMMPLHTFSFVSADETPANCTELLNCRGLKVFVDCYQVIAAEINDDCMLAKHLCKVLQLVCNC